MDKICVATVALTALIVVPAYGQTQPPPKTYTGSFGAGLALTGGNTEPRHSIWDSTWCGIRT